MDSKFNKTSINIQFGEVLNVDIDQINTDDLEYYKNELSNLKSNINCNRIPTKSAIIKYMTTDEYIDDNDVDDFIFFVKKIFIKYYDIIEYIHKRT
jgi:hypothetical protein